MSTSSINRRGVLAALGAAALSFRCNSVEPTASDADALALLDEFAENLLQLFPEAATSLGIDTGDRASLRSRLSDRSAEGAAAHRRAAPQRPRSRQRIRYVWASPAMNTSFEVVRSAYATSLEGFALSYGDITVGGWRNTPYVVIQNVGAYLDIPRFLDTDHRIENAADAEVYLARLEAYPAQLDGELERIQAAREGGLIPPAFLIDKALGQITLSAQNAREGGTLVESIERRTKDIPGNWAEQARAIAAQQVAPALERQIAELQAQRAVATNDAGMGARRVLSLGAQGVHDHQHDARRSPRDGPERVGGPARPDGHDPQASRLRPRLDWRPHEGFGRRPGVSVRRRRCGPHRDHGVHVKGLVAEYQKAPKALVIW